VEHAISPERLEELMQLAVHVAGESVAEDERAHPKVGAVLASPSGDVLLQCHRGEIPGAHAEFRLLETARERGIDTRDCVLFATLEPCTQRGSGKIPCAQRIAAAHLAAIYIGTLDPNPNITGRGELYLSYSMEVGRFPSGLARELMRMNGAFFAQHAAAHAPAVSPYASRGPELNLVFPKPRLSNDRNELLQQTLDLVSGDGGDIWVRAGDLSWWREAQITFLEARLNGRRVRISTSTSNPEDPAFREVRTAAAAIGAVVVDQPPNSNRIRGTMISPGTDRSAMVVIDERSRILLRAPDDQGLLRLLYEELAGQLDDEAVTGSVERDPELEPLTERQVVEALRRNVPQYAGAEIAYHEVETEPLRPLTRHLERFKVFRAARLEALQLSHPVAADAARIVGSPWPITPPVVEMHGNDSIVIDGTHRAFMHHRRSIDRMRTIVVTGVEAPLPARPLAGWQDVEVYNTKLPRERRYDNYTEANFRPIRKAFATLAGLLA
jgi:pyrimidine deaminase RibD-like protein